jgi:eukaryotic-like serine/threonine-protein kinase
VGFGQQSTCRSEGIGIKGLDRPRLLALPERSRQVAALSGLVSSLSDEPASAGDDLMPHTPDMSRQAPISSRPDARQPLYLPPASAEIISVGLHLGGGELCPMRSIGKTSSSSDTSERAAHAQAIEILSDRDIVDLSIPAPDLPPADSFKGDTILDSKYQLVRELGHGGMGSVWEAHNLALDIDVAIKLIHSDLPRDEHGDRLIREARAVARLGHPNIVRVFDVGYREDGRPFLVMELLRGRPFSEVITGPQRMDPVLAVRSLLPVAHALAAAHDAGFVHRDLKPENIFLAHQPGSPPRPILLDFGLALSWRDLSHRLTRDGNVVGTPAFMPPEQMQGEDMTYKGDIWSFSVVLYEAVTGRLPFTNTIYPRLQREIIEKPAPHFATHGISEDGLWKIVEKGLRKRPLNRWHDMRAMGQALAGWLLRRGVDVDVSNGSLRATWLSPAAEGLELVSSTTSIMLAPARDIGVSRRLLRQPIWRLALAGFVFAAIAASLWFKWGPSPMATSGANPPLVQTASADKANQAPAMPDPPARLPRSEAPIPSLVPAPPVELQVKISPGPGVETARRRPPLAGARVDRRARATAGSSPSHSSEAAPSAGVPIEDIKTEF